MEEDEIDEVIKICSNYELGYNAAMLRISLDSNPNDMSTKAHLAWLLGYQVTMNSVLNEHNERPH